MPKLSTSFRPTIEQRNHFTELFQEARRLRGLTQQQVSEGADISQTMVSTLEHGPYAGMNAVDLFKLARFYGISPNEVAASIGLYAPPAEEDAPIGSHMRALFAELNPEKQKTASNIILAILQSLLDEQAVWKRKLNGAI